MISALALVCALVFVIAYLLISNMQFSPPVRVSIVVTEIIFFLFVLLYIYGVNLLPLPHVR